MLSETSKKMRAVAIGSSDIAPLLGEDEHGTPLSTWMAKVGLGERRETPAMMAGQELEAAIARLYCRMTDSRIRSGGGTMRHRKHPWAVATVDRRISKGAADLLEVKNIGAFMLRPWRYEVPLSKRLQVQWQLEVTGLKRAHVVALLGGTNPRIYTVEHDPELAGLLIDAAHLFMSTHVWPAIEARAAQDEDWTRFAPPHSPEEAVDLADAVYPESNGCVLPCTLESRALARELEEADADRKAAKARWDAAEAAAKEMLGKADEIAGCFTWKHDEVGKVAWAKVAQALNPPPELVNKFTGAPGRRFLRKGKAAA